MSKILGTRLKVLREHKQLSKAEVARRLNVGNTTYANWEYGLREPNADTIVELANFYDVSTDYLLGHDPNDQDKELTVEAAIMRIKQYNGQPVSDQDQKTLISIAKAYFNSRQ